MGVDYPASRKAAMLACWPRRARQLLFLASRCNRWRRGRLGCIADHGFQWTDLDNGALAASGDDGNGTKGHLGSCDEWGVNLASMHLNRGKVISPS